MSHATLRASAWVGLLLLLVLALAVGRVTGQASAPAASAPSPSCPASLSANGHDYHGLTLTLCSFAGQDLSNANFAGATLTGVIFIKTNLSGADFSGATFADSGSPYLPTDFTLANLSNAKFVGAKFNGLTYLSYATLTCTDFSSSTGGATDLSNANFGDALAVDPQQCRPKFRGTAMPCDMIAQWNLLDLSGANISACTAQLQTVPGQPGHDFSGGMYSQVVFDGLDLSGSKWNGTVLEHASFQGAILDNASGLNGTPNAMSKLSAAKFNNASLQNVDLSYAELYGANFTNANLRNASFAGAFLQANIGATPPIVTAAVFDGAHLPNVSFANAQLQGTSFRYASLYTVVTGPLSPLPTFPCTPASSPCATASGADLTGTDFSNAFLYYADFGGGTTVINGTNFGSAILTGANFAGASFRANGGAAPDFTNALLQGAIFSANASLDNAVLLNAFVDFGSGNNPYSFNILYLQLPASYTGFRGGENSKLCLVLNYGSFSVVPPDASMTCPNGNSTVCGAGSSTSPPPANWQSKIAMANNPVPGWYQFDATYDKAAASGAICNGATQIWVW